MGEIKIIIKYDRETNLYTIYQDLLPTCELNQTEIIKTESELNRKNWDNNKLKAHKEN